MDKRHAIREIDRHLRMTVSLIRLVMFNIAVISGERNTSPVFDLCTKMMNRLKPIYKRIGQFENEPERTGKYEDWGYVRIEKNNLLKMRTTLRRVCEIYGESYKPANTQDLADRLFDEF
jgi:hypothetical protein